MKYPFLNAIDEGCALGKIIKNIRRESTVLECGCASGYMTKHLKEELDCRVYIVEYDPEGYEQAIAYAEDGVCGDLMDFEWVEKFRDIRFDYVVFADVLEHLLNPQKVLSEAANMIKEEGTIFISIPNVGHNDIVSKLINGCWDYTKFGLLDDSHIHFWGAENLENLAKNSGLAIILKDYTMFGTGCTEQYAAIEYQVTLQIQAILDCRPYGEVYQFVLGLQKEDYVKRHNIVCKDKFLYADQTALCLQKAEQDELLHEQLMREKAEIRARLEQVLSSRTWRYGRKLARMVRWVFRPGSLLTKTVATPVRYILKLWRS